VRSGKFRGRPMYQYRDYGGYVFRHQPRNPVPLEHWVPQWKVWVVHPDSTRIPHNSDAISAERARAMVIAQGGTPGDVV
jgi:hypothetical protein